MLKEVEKKAPDLATSLFPNRYLKRTTIAFFIMFVHLLHVTLLHVEQIRKHHARYGLTFMTVMNSENLTLLP